MSGRQDFQRKPLGRSLQRKLENWCILSYQNCVRLHEESVLLYRHQRYATAFALSVIALEEMGKYDWLTHGLFYEYFHEDESAQMIFREVYSHKGKQRVVINDEYRDAWWHQYRKLDEDGKREWAELIKAGKYLEADKLFPRLEKYRRMIGGLDEEKQDALYGGYPRKGKKVDLRARIRSPFRVGRKKAAGQITQLSDYLVLEAAGVIKGTTELDIEDLQGGITHRYLKYLRKLWPQMTGPHRRRYEKLMRMPDSEDE